MQPTGSCAIRLLGSLEVRVGDRTPAFRRKTRAVLAYLAATGQTHHRRALADLFCQEANDPAGALRWHLSRIRRQPGPEILLVEGDVVQVNHQACWVDCVQFQHILSRDLANQDLETLVGVVALYRGEFLEGAALPNAPEFELWLLGQRAHYNALYERGLFAVVTRLIALKRYAEAISWAQKLVQNNPLLEEAHAQLVWLYARTGQRQTALQQFDHCRDLLRKELAVEPSPELQTLHAEVVAGQSVRPYVSAPISVAEELPRSTSFVGREAELAQLSRAWKDTCGGQGRVVLLEAEAGGGKTRLAHEFGASLSNMLFLTAECYESSRALPYRPWIELLEKRLQTMDNSTLDQLSPFWLGYLTRLLPALAERLGRELPPAPPIAGGELERLFKAVIEFLFRLPDTPPQLIFVDNLQWADEASLQLFHFLARRVPQESALLVGAFRSEETTDAPALQTLLDDLRRASLMRLRLPPLTFEAITTLSVQLWPKLPDGYRPHVNKMLVQATGGNPLFVTEVMQELAHTTEAPATLPVPDSVRDLIRRRLQRLPGSSRQVIEAAAVLDSPVTPAQVQQISARSEEETITAIDLGLRRGLLEPQVAHHPVHYRFCHDLVREAVVSQLSHIRIRLLHRRAAITLETAGARAATLAYHWGMAGEPSKEGRYAALAGQGAAEVYANDEAVRYLERARQLVDDPGEHLALLLMLGRVLQATSQWARAEQVYRQALDLSTATANQRAEAQCQVALGRLMRLKGDYTQAVQWLEQAQSNFAAGDDSQGLSQTYSGLGAVYWSQLDYPRALFYFEQQLEIAQQAQDQHGICAALGSMGVVYGEAGDYSRALACYEQQLQIAQALADRVELNKGISNLAWLYAFQGYCQHALACYKCQLQMSFELGDRLSLSVALGNMVDVFLFWRDEQMAARLAEQAVRLTQLLNLPLYLCEYLHASARLHIRQARYAQAQALNDRALDIAAQVNRTDIVFIAQLMAIRLRVLLDEIEAQTAIAELEARLCDQPLESEAAAIQYEIWRFDEAQTSYRQNAASLYRNLHSQTPNILYRQRFIELTGESLPDPPPVPAPPEIVTASQVELESLLTQVDQMIADMQADASHHE